MDFDLDIRWQRVAEGIVSPEGPAVDQTGRVYLVSRWTGRVLAVAPTGEVTEVVQTGGKPQAVACGPDGRLWLADAKNFAIYEMSPTGSLTIVANEVAGIPFYGPNDLVVTDDLVIYVTDPGLDMHQPGRVLRVDLQTGQTTVLVDGLLFPNGITITGDGRYLVVAESSRHRVLRYELLASGQRLGPAEIVIEFPDHYPDGMAYDSAGNLLVARHGSGTIEVISPQHLSIASIPTGGKGCTNCVFGGEDFQTLYVTEDDQQALLATRWPVPGQLRFSRSMRPPS